MATAKSATADLRLLFSRFREPTAALLLAIPIAASFGLAGLLFSPPVDAEVRRINPVNKPNLRIRVGGNASGATDRVIFQVPQASVGSGQPVDSGNNLSGSGDFTVRFVLDTVAPPVNGTARFRGDSSQPMACTTPNTCGSLTIPMSTISWLVRDGDMMDLANSFSSTLQLLHQHDQALNPGLRYRDFVQFSFSNSEFLPAGRYRGTVNFSAEFR